MTSWRCALGVRTVLLLQLACLIQVQAQGRYATDRELALKRAPSAYTSQLSTYQASRNWRNAFAISETAPGKKRCAFLCSANLRDADQRAIATMAAAPQVYESAAGHPLKVVSAVAKQQCDICVVYAVLAAAETACSSAVAAQCWQQQAER